MTRRSLRAAALALALPLLAPLAPLAAGAQKGGAQSECSGQVYLTLDTGNMRDAERIAEILKRHEVRATFFVANERTPRGDHALDDGWRDYWRARVAEGHAFGNHTFDHVYFRREHADGSLEVRPQFGEGAGRSRRWLGGDVCRELARVESRFRTLTGRGLDPVWRAPGGKAPAAAMQAAASCGWSHVYWAPAGFLGDELPSDRYPNRRLLDDALRKLRAGDIMIAHLGIWSREDPFAPMLDPLIAGLKARGLCFATIPEHPEYRR